MAIGGVTFTQLVGTMSRYVNRQLSMQLDAAPEVYAGAYVSIAKRRIDEQLRAREMETTLTLSDTDFTDGAYTLPDDYLEMKEVILTNTSPTSLAPSNLVDVRRCASANAGSVPILYETTSGLLNVAPAPRTGDTFEVVYYARPDEDFSPDASNLYTNRFTQVILAASIEEFYLGHQDPERAAQWGALYRERLSIAETRESNALYSGYVVSTKSR